MNFFELPPSKQWAALKSEGETLAEVWFKPEGEPFALTFRIPRKSFQIPSAAQLLTTETLLKTVGIAREEVESWRHESASHSGMSGSNPELGRPLPLPPQEVAYLEVHVRLKLPEGILADKSSEPETPLAGWEALQARWRAIVGLEASIDTLRLSMEALQAEMETSSKKALATEVKVHALNADVAQWNKAKSRAHYSLPKAREFIHRATWAMGTPERKRLGELFSDDARPNIPPEEMDRLPEQLEYLLKDRQVLSAQGVTVYQECKGISAELDRTLKTLERNSAVNKDRKRRAASAKGKFFKDIRRWTGAE